MPTEFTALRAEMYGHRNCDIAPHLPVLEYFAGLCGHVTEFGVREARSTVALCAGCRGEVHSYDIEHTSGAKMLPNTPGLPCKWVFHQADTGADDLVIAATDLLFLDTLHTYDHLRKELRNHGRKAGKYLIFHDTHSCGERDVSGPDTYARGILPAIDEFLAAHPGEYVTRYRTTWCHGLWVLERLAQQELMGDAS